jgi:hypothetical protein
VRIIDRRNRIAIGWTFVVGALVVACGGSSSSPRPSPSLVTLDFSPIATAAGATPTATRTPLRSTLAASWPVGWDVAFCTAFADATVAHELVIDIERAIAEDNKSDAQGLANQLGDTTPIASSEITRLNDWAPAADLKANLASLLDLDSQAAAAYRSYFNDGVKSALHDARQLRNQVGKQVAPINEELQQLTALGMSCTGTDLKLESF